MKALARIAVLALVCLWMPLAAAAPPLTTVHRIGFLWNSSPSFTHHLLEAFRHGLHERGYVEGTHFIIESRYAEGDPTRLPASPPSWSASRWRSSSQRVHRPSRRSSRRPVLFRS